MLAALGGIEPSTLLGLQGAGAGMETNGLPPESKLASSRSIDYDYLLKRDAATKRTGELTVASYEYYYY
ncbi:hypothetical protein Trihar35433_906 [Trichoderma harzianum]|nr:hypothetical protein Trihar35433_906 [Trichoderma harzianum]